MLTHCSPNFNIGNFTCYIRPISVLSSVQTDNISFVFECMCAHFSASRRACDRWSRTKPYSTRDGRDTDSSHLSGLLRRNAILVDLDERDGREVGISRLLRQTYAGSLHVQVRVTGDVLG